ncbi:MAG: glutamine--fructose-6-phosphate transaminase (isomerizing) [Chloroflexi bacterium]|nr:MAG: glutamine--fructose-6-phosphate transaminase (isomerizing) [Chloroflexota bacterium]
MCGIVGYIGARMAAPIVLEGLRHLEYRGYDSAGIAVVGPSGALQVRREVGKLHNLNRLVAQEPVEGVVAIGHTRWATHGPPTQRNAHPHLSGDGLLAVVQNGIVENFQPLRRRLMQAGYNFASDTDTEVIAHLVHLHYCNGCRGDLVAAVRCALSELEGPSAVAVLCREHPGEIVVARLGNAGGVAVGIGEGEMFVASDVPALLPYTRQVAFLDDRQLAVIKATGAIYYDLAGRTQQKATVVMEWDPTAADKGEYRHFMQKEICEQGRSLADTLRGRIDFTRQQVRLDSLNLTPAQIRALTKLTIVACGTSYYAGLVGKVLIERLARLPVEVDYASEFRYRQPLVDRRQLVLAITQSGETVDTLAALEEARTHGARTAAIVNAVGSQAARLCDGVILMQVGPEIGVASTKAFTASLVNLCLLALYLGQVRGTVGGEVRRALLDAQHTGWYHKLAGQFGKYHNFLYLGRGIHYPIALEGALKLKEISYIHAEGYPAGEMKHGPIALVDDQTPTVVLAPRDRVYDKMISQVEQVKARGGAVLAVVHADDGQIRQKADAVLPVPVTHELLAPVLSVLPLQLFAYEVALWRNADVDQPRNLAKSVTVE